jgi:hypothetical protein
VAFPICCTGSMVSRCESVFLVAIRRVEGVHCLHSSSGFGEGIGITDVIGTRGHVDVAHDVAVVGDWSGEVIDV